MKTTKEVKIKCFSCPYCYNCKYYQNSLWDWYILAHPEDGCPAEKYEFDSLYKELLKKQQEDKKNGDRR